VVDVSGLNRISRRILANAAGAICGMVEAGQAALEEDRPLIAATMLGNTTKAVDLARQIFEAAGYEVLVFHAIGSGGRTMESLVAGGLFAGVFDYTIVELAQSWPAHRGAGPGRLRAAPARRLRSSFRLRRFLHFRRWIRPVPVCEPQFYPWNRRRR
jgi:uncharacterized protein (UPF0261 family)